MRKHYQSPISTLLCRGILSGILLFFALLFLDGTPDSKSAFMSQFIEFVQEVSAEHQTFTAGDWEYSDRRFKRFTDEYYKLFANQLTEADHKTLQQCKHLYLYYSTQKHLNAMIR